MMFSSDACLAEVSDTDQSGVRPERFAAAQLVTETPTVQAEDPSSANDFGGPKDQIRMHFQALGVRLVEIRALGPIYGPKSTGHYFDVTTDEGLTACMEHTTTAKESFPGVYSTFNEIGGDLADQVPGSHGTGRSVKQDDISRRRFFFIDVDPERSGNDGPSQCATVDELATAQRCFVAVLALASACDLPDPYVVYSGNGY